MDPTMMAAIEEIAVKVGPILWEKMAAYREKDHGSKVKKGAFEECSVEMFDKQAGIVINEDTRDVVMLTNENIQTCHFVKEKFRPTGGMKTFYYYDITFKNGLKSYVRLSEKYRDAMIASVKGNQIADALVGLLKGKD